MTYKYAFDEEALQEFLHAITWYGSRSSFVADGFAAAVKEKIKEICKDPVRYRNTYKLFRETSLKKYPYCIVYFVDEAKAIIIISAIYHHKRSPKNKYRK